MRIVLVALAFVPTTALAGFTLTAPATVEPGETIQLDVSSAPANATMKVVLGKGGLGNGPCPAALGGLCLGVDGQTSIVGTVLTNANGDGSTTFTVPAAVPSGAIFGLQAALGGAAPDLSNAVEVEVVAPFTCAVVVDQANPDPSTYDDYSSMGGPDLLLAMKYVPSADHEVTRLEVFTGEIEVPSALELWTDLGGVPGQVLGSGAFDTSLPNGWQGAELDVSVDVVGGATYWIVWAAPNGGQSNWDSTGGDLVDYVGSFDFGQSWFGPYTAQLKYRVLSCP